MKVFNKTLANITFFSIVLIANGLCSVAPKAQVEGLGFGVDTQLIYDDNIFREQDKESDTILQVAPVVGYVGLYGKHKIKAGYKGEYALFTENSDVNYTNHAAQADLDLSLTSKWSTKLGFRYLDKVEEPGTNNRELNDALDFTKYDALRANLETAYGTKDSIGQIVFKYARQTFNYRNNSQEYRDRTTDDVTGTFFWRVAPKSRVIFELRNAESSADNMTGVNQSFSQTSYLTGVTWEATAKTEGSLRIGYQDTQFDNPLIADLDGLSYFVDVDYKPDSDSLINVALSRTTRDNAELVLAGLETTDYAISWKNQLANNTDIKLEYNYRKDNFGGGASSRQDDTHRIRGKLSYEAYEWLLVYTNLDYMSRDSDNVIYEFDNSRVSLGVEVIFDQ